MNLENKIKIEIENYLQRSFYGLKKGIVINNDDPENLNRVILELPRDGILTGWCRPNSPYVGLKDEGFSAVPPIGSHVWVMFQEGDLSSPVYFGGDFNEYPEENWERKQKGNYNPAKHKDMKILRSSKGHSLEMNDKDGEEYLTLRDGGGNELKFLSNMESGIIRQESGFKKFMQKTLDLFKNKKSTITLSNFNGSGKFEMTTDMFGVLVDILSDKFNLKTKNGSLNIDNDGNIIINGRSLIINTSEYTLTTDKSSETVNGGKEQVILGVEEKVCGDKTKVLTLSDTEEISGSNKVVGVVPTKTLELRGGITTRIRLEDTKLTIQAHTAEVNNASIEVNMDGSITIQSSESPAGKIKINAEGITLGTGASGSVACETTSFVNTPMGPSQIVNTTQKTTKA